MEIHFPGCFFVGNSYYKVFSRNIALQGMKDNARIYFIYIGCGLMKYFLIYWFGKPSLQNLLLLAFCFRCHIKVFPILLFLGSCHQLKIFNQSICQNGYCPPRRFGNRYTTRHPKCYATFGYLVGVTGFMGVKFEGVAG